MLSGNEVSEFDYFRAAQTDQIVNVDEEKFAPVSQIVLDFFRNEQRTWYGRECYETMVSADYRNKFQPEWPGFFLEYRFEEYITRNQLQSLVRYAQDKKKGGIDLDLFFPQISQYGDLKAHSNSSSSVQGNDLKTIKDCINAPGGHVYYIVGSHNTEKDSDHEYEVTFTWNGLQHKSDLLSYAKKMKYSVTFTDVTILDICKGNEQYLKIFKQGVNSNGKPREPKIMVDRSDFEKFMILEEKL